MALDWEKFRADGNAQVGKLYIFGAKAHPSCDNPVAFDCAELSYWIYGRQKVAIPDYSDAQYRASVPVQNPRIGDLGFFLHGGKANHVGLYWANNMVLEARGKPYNKVILRPREKWEAWKDFSGWRRPISVLPVDRGTA